MNFFEFKSKCKELKDKHLADEKLAYKISKLHQEESESFKYILSEIDEANRALKSCFSPIRRSLQNQTEEVLPLPHDIQKQSIRSLKSLSEIQNILVDGSVQPTDLEDIIKVTKSINEDLTGAVNAIKDMDDDVVTLTKGFKQMELLL